MSKRISGKKIAEKIKEELKMKVSDLNIEIIFSIIYVGQDPIIDNFIRYKKEFGEDIGVSVKVYNFNKNIDQQTLISEIKNIYKKSDAVIVQLPLPKRLDTQYVLNSVPFGKDVDVLSNDSKSSFINGGSIMLPPVTGAIIEALKNEDFSFKDKNIVIVGYGDLVGKPFSSWLDKQEIKYNVIERNTSEEKKYKYLINADLIISGVGIPNLIKSDMIKEGVVLIDCGTSEAGKKVVGDIDSSCYEKSLFYTPVPGGIGPITIAILYQNILKTQNISYT